MHEVDYYLMKYDLEVLERIEEFGYVAHPKLFDGHRDLMNDVGYVLPPDVEEAAEIGARIGLPHVFKYAMRHRFGVMRDMGASGREWKPWSYVFLAEGGQGVFMFEDEADAVMARLLG